MKKKNVAVIIAMMLVAAVLGGCEVDEEFVETDNTQPEQTISVEAEPEAVAELDSIAEPVAAATTGLAFTTTDIDGNAVSLSDYSDAKVIMVNFWEPWCGPCVGEMPDLEMLYEEYSSEGFMILGVFSTTDMDDEAKEVLASCGTTYPILRYVDDMEPYITEYVPTTIFLDQNGNVLTDEPIVGANSYDDWKQIIEEYLNR